MWTPRSAAIASMAESALLVTTACAAPLTMHTCNCAWQVYGFDILLDASYRASLIEVNTGPDLASNTPLDKEIKYQLVSDLLHLVGVVPYDRWGAAQA